jgi:hypothetical protein
MNRIVLAAASLVVFAAGALRAAEPQSPIKSPEEQFKAYPNRLADIPSGWATTRPIRLQVCFNLKYPPNSPEANQFLKTMHDTISAMPFGVKVRVERVVTPAKYAYCNSLTFRDWQANRAYETSEVFLKYYREQWKPAVTEASEQLSVIDEANSTP